MNTELRNLADVLRIDAPEHRGIALAFGKECVARVAHLFELAEAHELYSQFADAVRAGAQAPALEPLAVRAAMLARSHPGSASIDGSGHSAVTATHARTRARTRGAGGRSRGIRRVRTRLFLWAVRGG